MTRPTHSLALKGAAEKGGVVAQISQQIKDLKQDIEIGEENSEKSIKIAEKILNNKENLANFAENQDTNSFKEIPKQNFLHEIDHVNSTEHFASTIFGADAGDMSKANNMSAERLLGELLRYLRHNQEKKLVQVCRSIDEIKVGDGEAQLIVSKQVHKELLAGRAYTVISEFFKIKNLKFSICQKDDQTLAKQSLINLLDGKLKIVE